MSAPSNLPVPEPSNAPSLTQRVLGLDWGAHMPWPIEGGIVDVVSADEGLAFLAAHRDALFEGHDQGSRFLHDAGSPARARWAREMDFFVVRVDGRLTALVVGHLSDWSTYYVRSASVLPEARNLSIPRQVLPPLFEHLARHGVERVEAETAPTNLPCLRGLQAHGFMVTSVGSSERWGTSLRLTRFLSAEAEAVFVRQFCAFQPNAAQKHVHTPQMERSTS